MDVTDKRSMNFLAENANILAVETSNFSVLAVNNRIQKLLKDGVIRNFTIVTDERRLGRPNVAFCA